MQHKIRPDHGTSHGNSSVGLVSQLSNFSQQEDLGDVSQHLLRPIPEKAAIRIMPGAQHRSGGGELRLPPGRVQVVNIEQLADALDDGNARRGWFLDNYNAYTQACTQAELAVESCASLAEYLQFKAKQNAAPMRKKARG